MEDKNARAILRNFEAVRPAPTAVTTTKWKWAEGVHLFPEAVCPFCKVVMRSTCIWQVSETAQRLRCIVKPDGSQLKLMPLKHPHVHENNGSICMNGYAPRTSGADTVAMALFLGIYPRSTIGFGGYRQHEPWPSWFRDYFGHIEHDEAGLRKRNRPRLTTGRVRTVRPKV